MEKLDQILRNQRELSLQMKTIKEKMASLEKKLAFVDISFDNEQTEVPNTAPMQKEAPSSHEPEPIPESEPFISESVPL